MTTVVAIDGPAGSGKSSVSRAAARELGFGYLDTGAAYRALSWYCLENGIDTLGPADVIESLPRFEYSIGTDPDRYFVRVGSDDVTGDIREPRVTGIVSSVARIPEVRQYLVDLFRTLMRDDPRPGIIVEGRDITTVVAPDAAVRILLTASERARLSRRAHQDLGRDDAAAVAATRDRVIARDALDSTVSQFTTAADGVVTIDSSELGFGETVDVVLDVVRRALP